MASLQHQLALVSRAEMMTAVVESHMNVSPSAPLLKSIFNDNLPARILYWRDFSLTAAEDPPIAVHLPEEVKVQAASVENCIHAISTTCSALAYWAEGMALKIREVDFVPNPVKHILLQKEDDDNFRRPADLHTVLVISPETGKEEILDLNRKQGCQLAEIWDDDGRVLDATYPQYGYDVNCQKTSDYTWHKTKPEVPGHSVNPFGRCFQIHQDELVRTSCVTTRVHALLRELGIQAMNNIVYCETERLGGPQGFLKSCSHEVFLQNQLHLVNAVRQGLKKARASADQLAFSCTSDEQKEVALQSLVAEGMTEGHQVLMAAFDKRRTSENRHSAVIP